MVRYTDTDARQACLAECEKRNVHKGRSHLTYSWKPLWTADKGWFPAFRPMGEAN